MWRNDKCIKAKTGPYSTFMFTYDTRNGKGGSLLAVSKEAQLAGITIYKDGEEVKIKSATSIRGDSPDGEGPMNLIDGNPETKWLDRKRRAVFLELDTASEADSISLTAANDAPWRDPNDFRLSGKDLEGNWWTLLEFKDESEWERGAEVGGYPFGFQTPKSRSEPNILKAYQEAELKKSQEKPKVSKFGAPAEWVDVMDMHNINRCMHGVPLLKWNAALAQNSAKWVTETGAEQRHSPDSLRSNVGEFSIVGENIALGATNARGVMGWYGEIGLINEYYKRLHVYAGKKDSFEHVGHKWDIPTNFKFQISSIHGKDTTKDGTWTRAKSMCHLIGHYSQMLWKTSTDVGCAMADESKSGEVGILTCQYGPMGNFVEPDGTCPKYVEYVPYPPVKSEEQCLTELGVVMPDTTPQCEWVLPPVGNANWREMVRNGEFEYSEEEGGCVPTPKRGTMDCTFEKVFKRGICVPEGYEGAPPLPSHEDEDVPWNLPWYQPRYDALGRSRHRLSHKAWVEEVLLTHNRLRCMHGAPPLKWSDELERHADSWIRFVGPLDDPADFLKVSPRKERMNLAGFEPHEWYKDGTKSPGVSAMIVMHQDHAFVERPGSAIQGWYDTGMAILPGGKPDLDVKACQWAGYAQILWKSATHVGCAFHKHSMTCEYGPGMPCMIKMVRVNPDEVLENVSPPIKSSEACLAGDR